MSIVSKDFDIPITGWYAESAPKTLSRKPITLRVFFDDSWTGTKDIVVILSGGSGLNPMNTDDGKVVGAINRNHVLIDVMANPKNYPFVANIHFPNQTVVSRCMELPLAIDAIYEKLTLDPSVSSLITTDSNLKVGGHSRGAGLLCEHLSLIHTNNPELLGKYQSKIVRYVVNSPTGNNSDGHYSALKSLQELSGFCQFAGQDFILVVGAGDTTHTTRAMMTRIYYGDIVKNPNIDFRVIGDDTYGHSWANVFEDRWIQLICTGEE